MQDQPKHKHEFYVQQHTNTYCRGKVCLWPLPHFFNLSNHTSPQKHFICSKYEMRKKCKAKLFLVPYRYPATQKMQEKKVCNLCYYTSCIGLSTIKKNFTLKSLKQQNKASFHTLTFMDCLIDLVGE